MADPAPSTGRKCHTCKKDETTTDRLKHCGRCMSTTILYCSRECQKADWRIHRQTCTSKTQPVASAESAKEQGDIAPKEHSVAGTSESPTQPKALQIDIEKPFHDLKARKWLHNRPKEDVYKLLIDTYRLRLEDDYNFGNIIDVDSIYGGAKHGKVGFTRFLRIVEQRPGLLPDWWSPSKAVECIHFGIGIDPSSGLRCWSDLGCAIGKSDVVEHYDDPFMPMQLRMFGEQVFGTGPGISH